MAAKSRILQIKNYGENGKRATMTSIGKLLVVFLVAASVLLGVWKYSLGEESPEVGFVTQGGELPKYTKLPVLHKSRDPWAGVPGFVEEANGNTVFRYKNSNSSDQTGKPLVLLDVYKKKFNWPPQDYPTLSRDTDVSRGHVIVTASNAGYYKPMLDLISSVQQLAPGFKIIAWDMGWTAERVKYIKSLCDVEYRKFDISSYPPHVTNLHNYAFKPLVIAETLKDYPRLVYMDSSIRFISTGNFSHTKRQFLQTGGILQMGRVAHSIFVATHKQLYKYLPCDMEKIKNTEMGAGGFLFVYRTERVFKNILLFWILCALDKNCIEPTKALGCNPKKLHSGQFAGCHRFDQSTLSILLGNHYNYNFTMYRDYMAKSDAGDFARISRGSYKNMPLKICNSSR